MASDPYKARRVARRGRLQELWSPRGHAVVTVVKLADYGVLVGVPVSLVRWLSLLKNYKLSRCHF